MKGTTIFIQTLLSLLIIAPVTSLNAADLRFGGGIGYSYAEPRWEGEIDDRLEDEYDTIGKGYGGIGTDGDTTATSGRLFASLHSDTAFLELGYALLGRWNIKVEDNLGFGERESTALYALSGIQLGGLPIEAYSGIHYNRTEVSVTERLKDERMKSEYNDQAHGYLLGVRYRMNHGKSQIFISLEQWKAVGNQEQSGKIEPIISSLGIRF